VEREQGVVEHVRVGEQDVRVILTDLVPMVRSGVAVIHLRAKGWLAAHRPQEVAQRLELVPCEGLDGEKVKGMDFRSSQKRLDDRRIVDE
jgi:hypothetical protein